MDPEEELLDEWLDYFQRTWIGPLRRRVRRAPRYQLAWWNLYERVLNGRARTNNSLEGWHHAFQHRVCRTHPSMRRLAEKLKIEQAANEVVIEQVLAGVNLPQQNKKYATLTRRIFNIVQQYATYDSKLNYVNALAHNF